MYIHVYVCVHAKSPQLCPTLCKPMDWSPSGFSRQEYWSGFPFPPPRDLPDPGIQLALMSPYWLVGSLSLAPPGRPRICIYK